MLYTLMVWTALGETESLERVAQTAIQLSMIDSLHLYYHYLIRKKHTSFGRFHFLNSTELSLTLTFMQVIVV